MSSLNKAFTSSIGKKVVMAITGLFLISFLAVHCGINALIFANDGGLLFNTGAHFMATNWLIRAMEIVLFVGIIWHIVQALVLSRGNKAARQVNYAVNGAEANSKWYSRWMGVLGTLILIFLVVHLSDFWVKSRFTGLPGVDANGHEDLYAVMIEKFKSLGLVVLYVLAMVSLAYHLLHGFASAFKSLGFNHVKYNGIIKTMGNVFSIAIPVLFALMPILIYLEIIK